MGGPGSWLAPCGPAWGWRGAWGPGGASPCLPLQLHGDPRPDPAQRRQLRLLPPHPAALRRVHVLPGGAPGRRGHWRDAHCCDGRGERCPHPGTGAQASGSKRTHLRARVWGVSRWERARLHQSGDAGRPWLLCHLMRPQAGCPAFRW